MFKVDKNYYLLPDEEEPTRAIQNKNCIGKVMLLCAVARPRYDRDGKLTFSGKIGMWPFVKEILAARRSDNRPRGTLETKSIKVDREVMREFYIDKVLPAIKDVWPKEDAGKTINLIQDNAKPHILPNDQTFAEAAANLGLDVKIIQQPPNSPDVNVNDLGFFRSLESRTDTRAPTTLKDLIKDILEEFANYDEEKLNKIFLNLQAVMVEIMNHGGGNDYKTPHGFKDTLERLPKRLKCPAKVYESALKILEDYEKETLKQIEDCEKEQVEKEEQKMNDKQAKKASKRKGRSQVIMDYDTVITRKEYGTWLEDPSSI